jgi:hypothetical protein
MGPMVAIAALAMVGLAIEGEAASTFNLECSGTTKTQSVRLGSKVEPWQATYRFDLSRKVYCSDECKEPIALHSVTETRIRLFDRLETQSVIREEGAMWVDRETGQISGSMALSTRGDRLSLTLTEWDGTCKPAPFTGFPKPKTLF